MDFNDRNPVEIAKEAIRQNAVFLDTETTGLKKRDEIIEIAVVDLQGNVLLNDLVKPKKLWWFRAARIHGITRKAVRWAPSFDHVWARLKNLLQDRPVCIYNSEFDIRLLQQTLRRHRLPMSPRAEFGQILCVMKLFARFMGSWEADKGRYRWFRLAEAAAVCKLAMPDSLHRARSDAELTRRLLLCIAEGSQ